MKSSAESVALILYGPNPIPTLLDNDGGVAGDCTNNHPVGPLANLGTVASAALNATTGGLRRLQQGVFVVAPGSPYAQFVSNYGIPAISSMAITSGDKNGNDLYIVCTTCHNQHVQNVYLSSSGYQPIAGLATGGFPDDLLRERPVQPGSSHDPTHVPSTMRFCLQCHFSMSSEFFGAKTVGTAF